MQWRLRKPLPATCRQSGSRHSNRALLLSADAAPVIAGSIDSPGETDKYEFVLQQGAQVVFDSLTDRSDLSWSLQGPQGDVVLGRALDATDGSGLTGSPVMTLAAGKYTLTLSGAGDATGDYRFRLLDLTNTAMTLTPGVTTSGVLSPANGTNIYQFNALAGDLYYFDHKSSTGSNDRWCLIDPHGRLVFDRSLSGSVMEPDTLAHSGVYTLLIEGAVNQTGAEAGYSFNVQPVTNDEVIGMPLGSSVTGSIGQAGQQDYYRSTWRRDPGLFRCADLGECDLDLERPARHSGQQPGLQQF